MKVNYTCETCEKDGFFHSTDFDTQEESDEGGMGARIERWTDVESECSECDSPYSVMINETEYPIGNFEEPVFSNATGIKIKK